MSAAPKLALVKPDCSLADIEAVLATKLHGERTNVIDIGRLLLEAKRKVDHGGWLPWLAKHFGRSVSTAENYMNAARFAEKFPTVGNLKLSPTALYWLADPENTPMKENAVTALYLNGSDGPEKFREACKVVTPLILEAAKTVYVNEGYCERALAKYLREAGITQGETRAYTVYPHRTLAENAAKKQRHDEFMASKGAGLTAAPAGAASPRAATAMMASEIAAARATKEEKRRATFAYHGTTPEIEAQYNDSRRAQLRGMVRVMLDYSKNPEGLKAAVGSDRLLEAAVFLTDLAARAPVQS